MTQNHEHTANASMAVEWLPAQSQLKGEPASPYYLSSFIPCGKSWTGDRNPEWFPNGCHWLHRADDFIDIDARQRA
ncbi:hypothetical protein [Pseudanabaena sp. UWO310]|uniref:hypothetical protein n=1 Tax=Pseudanabaena sp. UWO310 TaxID=2480795 RepID=UPI0016811454|nr:hypothetical protein [Pseudanabaena sp. UWO310]